MFVALGLVAALLSALRWGVVDGAPGTVLKNAFIPLGVTQCWHRDLWGRNTVQGRHRPFQEELMLKNSLLKVKHLQ